MYWVHLNIIINQMKPKRAEETGRLTKLHNEELNFFAKYYSDD